MHACMHTCMCTLTHTLNIEHLSQPSFDDAAHIHTHARMHARTHTHKHTQTHTHTLMLLLFNHLWISVKYVPSYVPYVDYPLQNSASGS